MGTLGRFTGNVSARRVTSLGRFTLTRFLRPLGEFTVIGGSVPYALGCHFGGDHPYPSLRSTAYRRGLGGTLNRLQHKPTNSRLSRMKLPHCPGGPVLRRSRAACMERFPSSFGSSGMPELRSSIERGRAAKCGRGLAHSPGIPEHRGSGPDADLDSRLSSAVTPDYRSTLCPSASRSC